MALRLLAANIQVNQTLGPMPWVRRAGYSAISRAHICAEALWDQSL